MYVLYGGGTLKLRGFSPSIPTVEKCKKGGTSNMTKKTLGMMRMKIVGIILRLCVAIVLIGVADISAVADGGQVPYPPGGSTLITGQ